MKTQHLIITLLFSLFFQPVFSHPLFQWLNTGAQKPNQIICLSGNKKNGRVIMTYSLFDKKKIDYCYMGDVQNGKPSGQGREFFKFGTVGFNKDSLEQQNFGANGFYLEVKGEFINGEIGGINEIVFHSPANKSQFQKIEIEKVVGAFDQTGEKQTFEFYFRDLNKEKLYYKGSSISKDEIINIAVPFSQTGISIINIVNDLEGLFINESNERFDGVCDKDLMLKEGIKTYQSGNEQITCYILKYDVYPVRIISSENGRFFVLTDLEQKELKRVSIVTDTISNQNLFVSLENIRNSTLQRDFINSRTLSGDYKVFEYASEFDVLLKFNEGKIYIKVLPKKSTRKPIISWQRTLLTPLDTKLKTRFADGYFFWWDSVHSNGNSLGNEQSWKFYDSIKTPFEPTYFGMKFEISFTGENSKYNVTIPVVFLSAEDRNKIRELGTKAISSYQLALKEKQARENEKQAKEKARKEQEEARRLALQKENDAKIAREKQIRVNKIKAIEKGDIICYSQEWEYSWDFLVVHDYEKYNMIATLIVDDISPSGNIIFVVNNIKSTSRQRVQYMKYGNLEIKENQKISAPKSDLISDNRFQFCR